MKLDELIAAPTEGSMMTTEVKDVVADLGKAKIALFDGEEVDWIAASAAIDRAISLLESLSSQVTDLERDVTKFQAIAEDKLADARLVSAGPKPDGGFGFDLTGGPIPYIAEYLFQFIGARDDEKPTSNYAEIEVVHNEFGPMTLTLQRHTGQTPHQLRTAAESRATAAEGRVALLEGQVEQAFRDGLAYATNVKLARPEEHDIAWLTSQARARLGKGGQ